MLTFPITYHCLSNRHNENVFYPNELYHFRPFFSCNDFDLFQQVFDLLVIVVASFRDLSGVGTTKGPYLEPTWRQPPTIPQALQPSTTTPLMNRRPWPYWALCPSLLFFTLGLTCWQAADHADGTTSWQRG